MTCSYHTKNPATVQCSQCARSLCPACDHRIRGFPFCQDCIVAGVEMLRYQQSRTTDQDVIRRKSSPFIATFLSFFVPGLGAAYNGQTSKAIVHFAIFASFFQMAVVTDGVTFFVLGVIGTWLFAALMLAAAQLMLAGARCRGRCDRVTAMEIARLGCDSASLGFCRTFASAFSFRCGGHCRWCCNSGLHVV